MEALLGKVAPCSLATKIFFMDETDLQVPLSLNGNNAVINTINCTTYWQWKWLSKEKKLNETTNSSFTGI